MSHTSPNDAFLQLFGTPYDRVQVTATAASTLPRERGSVSGLASAGSALLARRSPGPRLGVTKLSSSSSSLQTSIARWEESVHAFHFDDLDFHHDHDHHQPNATNMMEEVASSSCCSATAVSEHRPADEACAFRARSASLDFWGMDLSAPMSLHDEGQVYKASSVEPVERHELVSSVIKTTAPKRKRPSVTTSGEPSNSTSDSSAPKRAWRQPARSCLPCRQKKSRCDRREQCNSCTTRGMQCVWTGVARPLTDEELLAEAEGAVVPAPTAASALTCSSAVAKSVGAAKKAARVAAVTPPRLPSAPPVVPTAAVAAHVPASMASTTVPTMVASSPEQVEITRLRSIIKSLAQQLQLDLTTLLEPAFLPEPLIATAVPPPSTKEATTSTTFKKRRRSNLGPLTLPSPPALSYGSSSDSSSSSSSILGQISPELPFVSPTFLPSHRTEPSSTKHARRSSYGFDHPMEVFAGRNEEPSNAWLNPSSWLTAIPKTLMH
ncbi:BZ3500_MvSof-1268-A1-R1_Chr10-2g02929 [Microbotryum saponariae]|uniref:BZ3500_MvSof-1268-A1-R1_Chr10-2g02929 protein n=1 Tax=Microbotryum saponariae TaxID=289078 RepID=A0A2X0KYU7_9BASI|nr:BZ3501_MvSof-1269-A2-R1_Chr10-2g02515 [Microbotryum saponariae]SDA01762.1 BZ3500_MvSof-1268-A1-R1_Chr10-2g02929 [Microbotryum saponariae]